MDTQSSEWLTINDVSIALKLSRQSVSRLIGSGALKARDVSTSNRPHWRIHRQWLEEFKAERPQALADN